MSKERRTILPYETSLQVNSLEQRVLHRIPLAIRGALDYEMDKLDSQWSQSNQDKFTELLYTHFAVVNKATFGRWIDIVTNSEIHPVLDREGIPVRKNGRNMNESCFVLTKFDEMITIIRPSDASIDTEEIKALNPRSMSNIVKRALNYIQNGVTTEDELKAKDEQKGSFEGPKTRKLKLPRYRKS